MFVCLSLLSDYFRKIYKSGYFRHLDKNEVLPMNPLRQIKRNTIGSFRLVKDDVIELFRALRELEDKVSSQDTEIVRLYHEISQLKVRLAGKTETTERPVSFTASKVAQKVHKTDCVFAKNIKTENKVRFDSKTEALQEGFAPCACVSA